MSFDTLLTEEESCALAAVSPITLKQFVQFGFLNPVLDNGVPKYSERELRMVFSLGERVDEASAQPEVPEEAQAEPVLQESAAEASPEIRLDEKIEVVDADESTAAQQSDDSSVSQYELVALNRRLREEIRVLRDERDWLRQRLEKLESRVERDQMLLLSESQTIKALVIQRERKGFWQSLALPWFGPPPKQ